MLERACIRIIGRKRQIPSAFSFFFCPHQRKHPIKVDVNIDKRRENKSMEGYEYRGFGVRRKRDRGLSAVGQKIDNEPTKNFGIEWGSGMETTNVQEEPTEGAKDFSLNGKTLNMRNLPLQIDFQNDYGKLTIYLENNLLEVVKELKKKRLIQSYSKLISEALTMYLTSDLSK